MTLSTQHVTSTKLVFWRLAWVLNLDPYFFSLCWCIRHATMNSQLFFRNKRSLLLSFGKLEKNIFRQQIHVPIFQSPKYWKVVRATFWIYCSCILMQLYLPSILKFYRDQYMPMLLFQEERLPTFLSWRQEKRWQWLIKKVNSELQ